MEPQSLCCAASSPVPHVQPVPGYLSVASNITSCTFRALLKLASPDLSLILFFRRPISASVPQLLPAPVAQFCVPPETLSMLHPMSLTRKAPDQP